MAQVHTFRLQVDRVMTMEVDDVQEDPDTLVVEDGRISWVGRADHVPQHLQHLEVEHLAGVAVPGFIDGHTHITLRADGASYEEMNRDPDDLLSLIALRNLHAHLASGVTTIRDNGGRNSVVFAVREAGRRGYVHTPRMLLSGRPVTHSGGHFHFCNGVADSHAEIRRAVRILRSEGADHIKIMASGGGTRGNRSDLPSYQAEELRVAVETAHELDMLTTAHCHAAAAMRNAVEAGVDCIEHGYFYITEQATEYVHDGIPSGVMEYHAKYDGAITEAMVARDMYLSATLPAGGYRELLELRERSSGPDALSSKEQARREGLERRFERKLSTLQRLRADGLADRILITTDAGPLRTEFGRFSDAIVAAVESGLDVEQALAAVTRIPAQACGRQDIGTLARGKRADIVVLAGDPRRSLDHVHAPAAVFLGGARVRPFEAVVAPSWM